MERVLKVAALILSVQMLSGCVHKRYHTSFKNDTGYQINTIVTSKVQPSPAYGPLESGQSLMLTDTLDELIDIHYSYGTRGCAMDHAEIAASARPQRGGWLGVSLKPCGPPKP